MNVNEYQYQCAWRWKLRIRTAPSAPKSDREISLHILWNPIGEKLRPSKLDLKDDLLWTVWVFGSGMVFKVKDRPDKARGEEVWYYASKKEALAHYKKLVKEFPRSKEIDDGFPVYDADEEC